MSKIRASIPSIEGVKDAQVARILTAIKQAIEELAGDIPRVARITKLGASANLGATATKVNELIDRIQG